jgi:hypothetical protein
MNSFKIDAPVGFGLEPFEFFSVTGTYDVAPNVHVAGDRALLLSS